MTLAWLWLLVLRAMYNHHVAEVARLWEKFRNVQILSG